MELVQQTKQEVNEVLLRLILIILTITLEHQTLQSRKPLKKALLQQQLMQVAMFSKTTSLE